MKLKKQITPQNYRKAMNTIAKVGGIVGKAALASAIYSNPAILGTAIAAVGTQKLLGYGQKYADNYFKGKSGTGARLYRSSRDVANAGLNYASGNYTGAAKNTARLVGDSGFLSKNAQRKYTSVSNNYIMPTLSAAGAAQGVNKIYQKKKSKKD
jgi:hypothetical protein